jgi:tetratricopeptide (TPR) repeat protein
LSGSQRLTEVICYIQQWTLADASFQRALALEPGNARAMGFAGMLAMDLGRLDEVIALYRRAMEIDPLRPRGYYDFAMILFHAGRQAEAATVLKKALKIFPEMANAHC